MTANFTHRVIRPIPAPNDTTLPTGTLLDGDAIPRDNRVALESGEFIVALTPEELEELNAPVAPIEQSETPQVEVPIKAVTKKAPTKKAPVKKTATKPVKKSVAK